LRVRSLDDAISWATREAEILGDVEIDSRPVTEPWDIGIGAKPSHLSTRRFMVLRKGTTGSESGAAPSPDQRTRLSRLIEESTAANVHVVTEHMRPSARGRRYKNSRNGVTFFDGPVIESKELIAGYVVVSAESLEDTDQLATRYMPVVGADEVDVRELE
jgi:hypothetical protein